MLGMQGLSDEVEVCALRDDESRVQGGESIRGLASRVLYVYSSKRSKARTAFRAWKLSVAAGNESTQQAMTERKARRRLELGATVC